ncbi:alpha/beta hydrolase [uncultured Duncaniella sp.]|uniref:alpha/beta hydrolase n=2 Tax=uncultured Duncaniella sp. TaxID=2768039 RepID=UPI00262F05AD|nr:alpha/beta hydrolase [uncultured Duncaniella sp.]
MNHKQLVAGLVLGAGALTAMAQTDPLRFDPSKFTNGSITMPDGQEVTYKAYEGIFYVKNVEDPTYQTLNIYVPDKMADIARVPILLRTYVGGYAASTAKSPSPSDATGRALQEGYVVCIPGSRGSNSTIERDGKTIYTGTAPNGLLDLKAAVRYLRYNDALIPGESELIFTDGTSAGGAMSSLLGATGNSKDYDKYLKKMGAADARDDVYAAICYCPITDLNHADMEYEWLYGCTNTGVRHLSEAQIAISDELAAECPAYINSLGLTEKDGTPLTADNYKDYIKSFLIESAHRALQEGCEISDTIGFTFYQDKFGPMGAGPGAGRGGMRPAGDQRPPMGDGRQAPSFGPGSAPRFNKTSDFVTGLDLDKYLSYVASVTPLKTPPAFDQMGVLIDTPSPENKVFGNDKGEAANFTDFSLRHRLHNPNAKLDKDMVERVAIMNPMNYIGSDKSDVAPNWYIRHGAKDRDTSFLVPINLATKLQNSGKNVDFALPWNRPHSGDYNLDDLFRWIASNLEK